MASQGPNYPNFVVQSSVAPESAEPWVGETNINSDNGVEASITAATFDSPDISQRIVASQFGFTIPAGATIDGIVVEIDRRGANGTATDYRVQLRDAAGNLVGDNKADTVTTWPAASTVATYGSPTDTWNATPTDSMVNNTNFGLVIAAKATAANADVFVDYARITVYYTTGGGGGPTPVANALMMMGSGV